VTQVRSLVCVACVVEIFLAGCSPLTCMPDTTSQCVCWNGQVGTRTCNAAGTDAGTCRCVPGQYPVPVSRSDRLMPGEQLAVGRSITSADNRFTLIMQGDGNLVLYAPGDVPMWASGTAQGLLI
jgi:hypothetical protein